MMKQAIGLVFLVILLASCVTQGQTGVVEQAAAAVYTNFEDNSPGNWTGRGDATLSIAGDSAYQGQYSLLTTNRKDGWHGPQLDLSGILVPGGVYSFSAWVKIKEGEPDSEIIMTIQRDKSGTSAWDRVTARTAAAGTWINLSGDYEVKHDFDTIAMYIESASATVAYYLDEVSVTPVKTPVANEETVSPDAGEEEGQGAGAVTQGIPASEVPSLYKIYQEYFPIGTAVELAHLEDEEGDTVVRHFNSLTAENAMKPQYMAPAENKYFFDRADELVAFARRHNMLVRGHTLLWHTQNAQWMFYETAQKKASRELLLKRLENYITTVVSRYKGKVYAWDVVNEVVDGAGLRQSEWLEIIGEDYIAKAFIFARRADPDAKLFINDYNTEEIVKGDTLYRLVKKLKEADVPVDGIGMQFHIGLDYPSATAITDSLKKWSELGVEIHITELDVSLNSNASYNPEKLPEELALQQGYRYKELFNIFKQFKNITNVTLWGFFDGHTWLHTFPFPKADWPLPFDKDLNAKYAYWGMAAPDRLPTQVAAAAEEKNNFTALAIKGQAVIDGQAEEIWESAPVNAIDIYVEGQGAQGTGSVLWDEQGLYLLIKVQDAHLSKLSTNAYEQDSVEIFIDEQNNKSVDYGEDDAQHRINFKNEKSSDAGFPGETQSAVAITEDGYQVEVRIPFKTIKGAPDVQIGFDLQINDDAGTGKRSSIAKWNDPTNETYRNTSNFGTLILGE